MYYFAGCHPVALFSVIEFYWPTVLCCWRSLWYSLLYYFWGI